jgi:hypothetical protein
MKEKIPPELLLECQILDLKIDSFYEHYIPPKRNSFCEIKISKILQIACNTIKPTFRNIIPTCFSSINSSYFDEIHIYVNFKDLLRFDKVEDFDRILKLKHKKIIVKPSEGRFFHDLEFHINSQIEFKQISFLHKEDCMQCKLLLRTKFIKHSVPPKMLRDEFVDFYVENTLYQIYDDSDFLIRLYNFIYGDFKDFKSKRKPPKQSKEFKKLKEEYERFLIDNKS